MLSGGRYERLIREAKARRIAPTTRSPAIELRLPRLSRPESVRRAVHAADED